MRVAKWIIVFIAVFNFGRLVADALTPATANNNSRALSGHLKPRFITSRAC